jgi:hypothetical protein
MQPRANCGIAEAPPEILVLNALSARGREMRLSPDAPFYQCILPYLKRFAYVPQWGRVIWSRFVRARPWTASWKIAEETKNWPVHRQEAGQFRSYRHCINWQCACRAIAYACPSHRVSDMQKSRPTRGSPLIDTKRQCPTVLSVISRWPSMRDTPHSYDYLCARRIA